MGREAKANDPGVNTFMSDKLQFVAPLNKLKVSTN